MTPASLPALADWGAQQDAGVYVLIGAGLLLLWLMLRRRGRRR